MLDGLVLCGTALLTFTILLVFLPFLFDASELPKQTLLVFGTLSHLLLASVRALVAREIILKMSSAYTGIGAVLVCWILASILSHYPYASFLGIERQEFMSVGLFGYVASLDVAWKMRGSVLLALSIGIQLVTLAILDDWRPKHWRALQQAG